MGSAEDEEAAVRAAIRAGDDAAFALLAGRYRRELHVHCYRMVGSFEEAEDLVQETLLRAWKARRRFKGKSRFRTWLYRIAANACLSALARSSRPFRGQLLGSLVSLGACKREPSSTGTDEFVADPSRIG
jgi:RNA polymerase sigma-70 factor (ECF subfamily)